MTKGVLLLPSLSSPLSIFPFTKLPPFLFCFVFFFSISVLSATWKENLLHAAPPLCPHTYRLALPASSTFAAIVRSSTCATRVATHAASFRSTRQIVDPSFPPLWISKAAGNLFLPL
jgi:hypothetical protein